MHVRSVITTAAILSLVLLAGGAAVSSDQSSPAADALPPSQMPVAIAQPLAAMDGGPLARLPSRTGSEAMLPESGMLVLVGSALMGLAALVRRTTPNS